MSDKPQTAQDEVDDLLAELNAEFGKKKRVKSPEAPHKALNKAFHLAHPQLEKGSSAKLELLDAGDYTRATHLAWIQADQNTRRYLGLQPPKWLPEARVTWIVHQHCAVCQETNWYTGNEFIRFRRNLAHEYRVLSTGQQVRIAATVLRRIGDCDPELIALGPADGTPLPDEQLEEHETVLRCPACFHLEKHCSDMWWALVEKPKQVEFPGLDQLLEEV